MHDATSRCPDRVAVTKGLMKAAGKGSATID